MQERELIPLVHGQSQVFRISYEVLKSLDFKEGELLRLPSPDFFRQSAEAMKRLPLYQREIGKARLWHQISGFVGIQKLSRLDHLPDLAPFLLSATIGLEGGYSESGLWYVFGGPAHKYDTQPSGNQSRLEADVCKELVSSMIREGMRMRGGTPEKTQEVLVEIVDKFFPQATRQSLGQLLVIGLPLDRISEWAYASGRFGIEARCSIKEMVDDFAKGKKPTRVDQVRLCLTQNSLHREHGVKIVNLMDEERVEEFCKGVSIKPLAEEEALRELQPFIKTEKSNEAFKTFQSELKAAIARLGGKT
jgi:hypothetical protein